MKKSFFLMVFLYFYFLSQSAQAAPYDYLCDSRPNDPLSLCQECAPKCDYTYLESTSAQCNTACPAGTILVDCNYVAMWHANCITLHCGDAGIPSGNTCIQDSSLDSSCLDSTTHRYGFTDNTAPLSCTCYPDFSLGSEADRIMKKVDGTVCTKNGNPGQCTKGKCITGLPLPTACPDGTPEGSCCSAYPGKKCTNTGGYYVCTTNASCSTCTDSDANLTNGGIDIYKAGTCKDTAGGLCDASTGGCTDACASSASVYEYYCAGSNPLSQSCMKKQMTCPSGQLCWYGKCEDQNVPPPQPDPTPAPQAGGCAYWAMNFQYPDGSHPCPSGCPQSYYDQQFVCCESIGSSDCRTMPACASYNPSIGETPCCNPQPVGYDTCTKEEQCTPTGCQNVCNLDDKTSDLYCEKCDSCRDGVQNCGEPDVDRCGEPCTMTVTSTSKFNKFF